MLLAFAAPEVQGDVLATPLQSFTENTLSNAEHLARELATIRRQGICITEGELEPGAVSASAPVRDALGEVVAAFIVAAPVARFGSARVAELVGWACDGAALATTALGGRAL